MTFARRSNRRLNRGRAGSYGSSYYPWLREPGAVLWMSADQGITTTNASVTDPTNLTSANWTRTGMTAVADASGTLDQLTATATTATIQQVPSAFSTVATYLSFTVDFVRVADDWVCVEFFASAGGRVWFNLNTVAVGTVGANLSASIQAIGGGVLRATITSALVGGNYLMIRCAGADNSLTCTVGHSFIAGNVTVDQTRASAFTNLVSGVATSQGTVNLQPSYLATGFNGKPGLRFFAQQDFTGTEAAVVTALTHNANHTLVMVVSGIGGANGTVFAGASSAISSTRVKTWGRAAAADTWVYQTIDNAAATITSSNTTGTYAAGAHIVAWRSTGGTVDHRQDLAAQTLDVTTNGPAALTPDRFSIGCRADQSPDNRCSGLIAAIGLWNVALDSAALGRVEAYLRAKWGTP